MSKTLYLGLDPGRRGRFALIDADQHAIEVCSLPKTEKDIVDHIERVVRQHEIAGWLVKAVVEKITPFGHKTAIHRLGESAGFLRCCLYWLEVPFVERTPQQWQRQLGFSSKGDINVVKAKAQEIFPSVAVTHSTSSALLLAECARLYYARR